MALYRIYSPVTRSDISIKLAAKSMGISEMFAIVLQIDITYMTGSYAQRGSLERCSTAMT